MSEEFPDGNPVAAAFLRALKPVKFLRACEDPVLGLSLDLRLALRPFFLMSLLLCALF